MNQHVNQRALQRFVRYKPYLLNLGLTTLILLGLALFKGFAPFGSNSMLTIDLGQQYIDFFSLFRFGETNGLELLNLAYFESCKAFTLCLEAFYAHKLFGIYDFRATCCIASTVRYLYTRVGIVGQEYEFGFRIVANHALMAC